jgi:hypothetical protein
MENNLFSCLFPCESESYSDWFDSEAINIGLPNLENRNSRRIRYFANGRHGGRLIQNTQINNVSTFLYDDIMQLQEKHGIIHYADEKGQHLKVIQDRKVTRVPIGRVTLEQAAAGKGVVAATKEVLGVPDPFESDFGTVHPGSVIKYETRIYFFDFYAKAICRDAGNGVQDISFDYNFKTLIQNACSLFGTAENVDVISSYDNEHQMVLWTFIDKTTTSNSFTIGFRDSGGRNKDGYIGKFRFIPDYYGLAKNTLVSWKNNLLWLHNSSNTERCTFYNVNYSYWVTPIFNKLWQTVKRYLTLILSTDKVLSAPNAGDISIAATSNNPNGMVSLLKSGAFSSVQGNFIAEIGKNMITHQSTAEVLDLIDGDDMQGQSMTVRLEGNENTEHKLLSVEAQGVTSNV